MTHKTRLTEVTARTSVEQGRIEISDDETDAHLLVKQKHRTTPLSETETHLILKLITENSVTEIGLDARDMDGLADAIHTIQEEYHQ